MRMFERRNTLDALTDFLEREKKAILRGDFAALERMLREKQRLIAAVNSDCIQLGGLKDLQRQLGQNSALLSAAANGIRAAGKRISRQKDQIGSTLTYDQSGVRHKQESLSRTMERRV